MTGSPVIKILGATLSGEPRHLALTRRVRGTEGISSGLSDSSIFSLVGYRSIF